MASQKTRRAWSTFEELRRRRQGFKRGGNWVSKETGRTYNFEPSTHPLLGHHIHLRFRRTDVLVAMSLIFRGPFLEFRRVAITRPIELTMRPHYDKIIVWWRDYMRLFLTYSCFDLLKLIFTDRQIDGLIERGTGKPSYRYVKMHLEVLAYLFWQYFARKCWFSLFLTKAWRTDGRNDRLTDGPTDG